LDGEFKVSLEGAPALALFALWFGYFVVTEATLGATVGKLLVGLRVLRADGGRVGWGASLVRNALRLIDLSFAGLVGAALMWLSPWRQRLGDRVAGAGGVRPPAAGRPRGGGGGRGRGAPPAGVVTVLPVISGSYPVPFVEGL